ncbi:MAG TPA: FHA domain-containing protein [Alphaproteobacteria bacterium]|nr:FHA domain-containing protein [Alphaproteobacteria bacterium]
MIVADVMGGASGDAGRAASLAADVVCRGAAMAAAALVAIAAACGGVRAEVTTARSGQITLRATQATPLRLQLDIHAPPPARIASVAGSLGGTALVAPSLVEYPAAGQLTAIYILIDTSDPARRRAVARKIRHIRQMMTLAKPHHRFGLARFDQQLRVLVPLGAGPKAVEAALANVKADGLRTYFFEAAIEASRQLGAFQADRRALFILSDGKIEDVKTAYDVRALVAAARRASVRVYGMGYSGSAVEPREFQNLRVPSKETGGRFVKTNARFDLPADFLASPFAALGGGGRTVLDLTPARSAGLGGPANARITVALDGGQTLVATVPVLLPTLPLGGFLQKAKQPRYLPYTIGGGVAVLVVLALLFRWFVRLRRRLREAREAILPAAIAVLEFVGETGSKFEMVKRSISIGRRKDNDLALGNGSVSGYHATIHRKSDGSFIITDRDSENGVAINDEEVKIAELKDGDEVDLGEVRFRFSLTGAT